MGPEQYNQDARDRSRDFFAARIIVSSCMIIIMAIFLLKIFLPRSINAVAFLEDVGVEILGVLVILRIWRGTVNRAEAEVHDRYLQSITTRSMHGTQSKRLRKLTRSEEDMLLAIRRHPINRIREWAGMVAILPPAIIIFVDIHSGRGHEIVFGVWLAIMAVLCIRLAIWNSNRLGITNARMIETDGLFNVTHRSIRLQDIRDVSYKLHWSSRLLSFLRFVYTPYGTLIVESAGPHGQVQMPDVPNVEAVQDIIVKLTHPKDEVDPGRTSRDD